MEKPFNLDLGEEDVARKRRERWRPNEVSTMLNIIKNNNFVELLHGRPLRNKAIFIHVQKELKQVGIHKTTEQIKGKFKVMKIEYFRTKRHNAISGNSRIECDYYDLLHEILDQQPRSSEEEEYKVLDWGNEEFMDMGGTDTSATASTAIESTTTAIGGTNKKIKDSSQSEYDNFDLLQEILDQRPVASESEEDDAVYWDKEEFPETSPKKEAASTTTSSIRTVQASTKTAGRTESLKTFRDARKRTYQQTISSFTDEWKKMQEDMMKRFNIKQKELVADLKSNDDALLAKLEKLMEKDRKETIKELKELFKQF